MMAIGNAWRDAGGSTKCAANLNDAERSVAALLLGVTNLALRDHCGRILAQRRMTQHHLLQHRQVTDAHLPRCMMRVARRLQLLQILVTHRIRLVAVVGLQRVLEHQHVENGRTPVCQQLLHPPRALPRALENSRAPAAAALCVALRVAPLTQTTADAREAVAGRWTRESDAAWHAPQQWVGVAALTRVPPPA